MSTVFFSVFLPALLGATAALGEELPVPIDRNKPPLPRLGRFREHIDQSWVSESSRKAGSSGELRDQLFDMLVERGDDFFDNLFTSDAPFAAGANVGQGQRFTRVPRADLKTDGEWASHFPARATGPNAQSCIECHTVPQHDGGGFAAQNAIRDPLHSGEPQKFINRNTTHLFGLGAVQLLAEEMTSDLQAIQKAAQDEACGDPARRSRVTRNLISQGISFGTISVQQLPGKPAARCRVIKSGIQGIDDDLVVKPFQWKGTVAFIRDFNRGAAHNENGLQGVELVGEGIDGDFDGVSDEVSVGDLTALTVYTAAQPRPTTEVELARLSRIPPLQPSVLHSIERGFQVFSEVGCVSCHVPQLKLRNSVFSEPSQSGFHRDAVLPSGQDPIAQFLSPGTAITFDLTKEVVDEIFTFKKDMAGMALVDLFGDLKRHDLGPEDAESIDEAGTGASTWLTRPLWGLGSTGPYLHDGRATTPLQAIEFHGGEAEASRARFRALPANRKSDLGRFLLNLRLYKTDDDDS
jgi:mono/diheme cytochrome c family protein